MAGGDAASPSSITCMTLFFSFLFFLFLLLSSHFSVALTLHSFSSSSSTKDDDDSSNRNTIPAAQVNVAETNNNAIHVPQKRPRSGVQKTIFNSSAHEVPSGPNPISNR